MHFPKLKTAYFNEKILLISLKLNFFRKTLGYYGLILLGSVSSNRDTALEVDIATYNLPCKEFLKA